MSAVSRFYSITNQELGKLFERRAVLAMDAATGADVAVELSAVDHQIAEYRREAIEAAALEYQRLDGEAAAVAAKVKPIIDELQAEVRYVEQQRDGLAALIKMMLPPGQDTEFVGERASAYYSSTSAVEVIDDTAVPIEFCEVKTVPSKRAIKAALEAGQDVTGAQLQVNYHLRFGPGGERGEEAAKRRRKSRAAKQFSATESLGAPQ